MGRYIPERGDIILTNFDPSAGREQAFKRPALVLSQKPFNDQINLTLVAPITSTVRGHGFEVHLKNTQTQGVALCQQVKMIDYDQMGVQFIEKAPTLIINEALAKVRAIVS